LIKEFSEKDDKLGYTDEKGVGEEGKLWVPIVENTSEEEYNPDPEHIYGDEEEGEEGEEGME
jgi:hypothetical protein